jgi:hypothetical protein
MYQNFIIPYLYKVQHVLGDTPPITRSLKLHGRPLVFHTWKVVGRGPCQAQDATMYQNVIIPYLYEAQHVSGDTPPIIRSLKLHWQPLVFHTWEVVGRVSGGPCQVLDATMYQNLLFHVYIKLNMFRATHSPSSGA